MTARLTRRGTVERLFASLGDRLPLLQRSLRESIDDLDRAIRCREYAGA